VANLETPRIRLLHIATLVYNGHAFHMRWRDLNSKADGENGTVEMKGQEGQQTAVADAQPAPAQQTPPPMPTATYYPVQTAPMTAYAEETMPAQPYAPQSYYEQQHNVPYSQGYYPVQQYPAEQYSPQQYPPYSQPEVSPSSPAPLSRQELEAQRTQELDGEHGRHSSPGGCAG
jgi:hypothetical protein